MWSSGRPHLLSLQGRQSISSHSIQKSTEFSDTPAQLKGSGKRQYLKDYKGISVLFSPKTVGLPLFQAGVLSFASVMKDFQEYLDLVDANEAKGGKKRILQPFPWEHRIMTELPVFQNRFIHSFLTSILRRLYDSLSVSMFSPRVADKLCKDLALSTQRKFLRLPSFTACWKLVITQFRTSTLYYVASITTDMLLGCLRTFRTKNRPPVLRSIRYFILKSSYLGACLTANAVGYGVGSYFHHKYGGMCGSMIAETIVASIVGEFLGKDIVG
jgi:hypothetical protein